MVTRKNYGAPVIEEEPKEKKTEKKNEAKELFYEVRSTAYPLELVFPGSKTRRNGVKFTSKDTVVKLRPEELRQLIGSKYFEVRSIDASGAVIHDWIDVLSGLEGVLK